MVDLKVYAGLFFATAPNMALPGVPCSQAEAE
jgi:hypothetical protein